MAGRVVTYMAPTPLYLSGHTLGKRYRVSLTPRRRLIGPSLLVLSGLIELRSIITTARHDPA